MGPQSPKQDFVKRGPKDRPEREAVESSGKSVTICEATAENAPGITDIYFESLQRVPRYHLSDQEVASIKEARLFEARLDIENARYSENKIIITCCEDRELAYAKYRRQGKDEVYIAQLFARENDKKAGTKTIEYIKNDARQIGAKFISVIALPEAVEFYKKMNFVETAPEILAIDKSVAKRFSGHTNMVLTLQKKK